MTDAIIRSIAAALEALAAIAPAAAAAFTGGQTVEEAVKAARESAEGLPVRTGDGGAWEADLERRKSGE